jgi:hypothetical protein
MELFKKYVRIGTVPRHIFCANIFHLSHTKLLTTYCGVGNMLHGGDVNTNEM